MQTPYTPGGLEKSAIQLIGFAKTSELAPGASETVTIEINPALFASYDENAVKSNNTQGAWVLESGDYYFAIGNGAHEALNNILAKKLAPIDFAAAEAAANAAAWASSVSKPVKTPGKSIPKRAKTPPRIALTRM